MLKKTLKQVQGDKSVLHDKNIKGFTLIELLVVVLIIAILGAIALPKYMVTRDRAHLAGLMTIGKNVNDALDRRSLFDDTSDTTALDLLDISFKKYDGTDCTDGTCRITVSGYDYNLQPTINSGGGGKNFVTFGSYNNTAFPRFDVYTDDYNASVKYKLYCGEGIARSSVTGVDTERCLKIGASFGATCGSSVCSW